MLVASDILSYQSINNPEMKTCIINLASSTERRAMISAQCHIAGIAYEFIDAVNGKSLTEGKYLGK